MLLPDNIHPKNSIYYNGAIVLEVLQKNNHIELLELYLLVKKIRDISFPIFIYLLIGYILLMWQFYKKKRLNYVLKNFNNIHSFRSNS